MPTPTPIHGINKPLGNENVTRALYNAMLDHLDTIVRGINPMTTAQRDALTAAQKWAGRIVHVTDAVAGNEFQRWDGAAWTTTLFPYGGKFIGARHRREAAHAIGAGADASLNINSVAEYNTDSFLNDAGALTLYEIPNGLPTGYWRYACRITWAASSTGTVRRLKLEHNPAGAPGPVIIDFDTCPPGSGLQTPSNFASATILAGSGDTFRPLLFHDATTDLDVSGPAGEVWHEIAYLGRA